MNLTEYRSRGLLSEDHNGGCVLFGKEQAVKELLYE